MHGRRLCSSLSCTATHCARRCALFPRDRDTGARTGQSLLVRSDFGPSAGRSVSLSRAILLLLPAAATSYCLRPQEVDTHLMDMPPASCCPAPTSCSPACSWWLWPSPTPTTCCPGPRSAACPVTLGSCAGTRRWGATPATARARLRTCPPACALDLTGLPVYQGNLCDWEAEGAACTRLSRLAPGLQVVAAVLKSMQEEGRAAGLKGFEQVRPVAAALPREPAASEYGLGLGVPSAHPKMLHASKQGAPPAGLPLRCGISSLGSTSLAAEPTTPLPTTPSCTLPGGGHPPAPGALQRGEWHDDAHVQAQAPAGTGGLPVGH